MNMIFDRGLENYPDSSEMSLKQPELKIEENKGVEKEAESSSESHSIQSSEYVMKIPFTKIDLPMIPPKPIKKIEMGQIPEETASDEANTRKPTTEIPQFSGFLGTGIHTPF